jgi:hypothetical protein
VVKKEFGIDAIKDDQIYGGFPEFVDYFDEKVATKTLNRIKKVKKEKLSSIIETIPKEWEISDQVRNEWIDFLLLRAEYVSKTFLWLWHKKHQTLLQTLLPFEEN